MSWNGDYSTGATDPDTWSRIFVRAFVLAAMVHLFLFAGFYFATLNEFGAPYYDRIYPRVFAVEALEIDPKLLDQADALAEDDELASKPDPDKAPIQIPSDSISFETLSKDIIATPAAPASSLPIIQEMPRVETSSLDTAIENLKANSAKAMEQDLESVQRQLIEDRPASAARPVMEFPAAREGSKEMVGLATNLRTELQGRTSAPPANLPGFSSLDGLLNQAGPLNSGTAPILMPTDLLFGHDSYALHMDAADGLTKLGQIIQRNPRATFVIEGHTDATGTDAYNIELSQRRAAAVKVWLVRSMGIDPSRIATRGFGRSKLIVPGNLSIEQQAINRRVEIVIRSGN